MCYNINMSKFKEIIIKADTSRECIEDYIASHILEKWNSFEKVDDIRYIANMAIINFVLAFAETKGISTSEVPQEVKEKIARATVKIERKLCKILQAQLQKKSKMYRGRHGN